MNTGNSPRSLLERGLAAAGSLCFIAVLLVIAIHMIESVLVPLLIVVGVAAAGGLGVWWLRRQRNNRFW